MAFSHSMPFRPLLAGLVLTTVLSGCIAPPKPPVVNNKNFVPPITGAFAWGISTSSYQYENPDVTPGAPSYFQTDWDLMVAKGGAPEKGNALYSWTEFDKDLEALKKIGVTHYRFSIEWARVEPRPGEYNTEAIRRYVDMARKLKAAGIEPVVCLWHFTFPDWLTDPKNPSRTNWLHPDFAERWQAYVDRMVRTFGRHVRYYAPQNEPNGQITTAYLGGMWPPRQILNFKNYHRAIVSSAEQFRAAAAIIKKHNPQTTVMSVEALPWWKHAPLDITRALYNEMQNNNFNHLDRVYDVCDIIGFNYYYSQAAGPLALLSIAHRHGPNFSMMGWRINPEGLYRQIQTVAARYQRPMMITENGIATHDDEKRISYLREHIDVVRRARREGYDVRGYFVWSLADNYEWHYGYEATFGLGHMNPETYVRELKPSAYFYRNIIREGEKFLK